MQVPLLKLLRPVLLLLLLLPAGCAKSPSTGGTSPVSGPQLLVTMTVAGNINPNYYYYILFNVNNTPGPSNSSVTGPIPVVVSADNNGNGYAAGAYTNYVEYNSGQPGGTNFNYYVVSANLFQSQPLGQSKLIQAQVNGNTLIFQLPLAYLATSTVTADQITSLQVNFITTNFVPTNGQTLSTPKYFDALYPPQQAGNSYVNLIIRDVNGTLLANTFTNTGSGVNETSGDVAQYVNGVPIIVSGTTPDGVTTPDLDITGWTIQLTAQ